MSLVNWFIAPAHCQAAADALVGVATTPSPATCTDRSPEVSGEGALIILVPSFPDRTLVHDVSPYSIKNITSLSMEFQEIVVNMAGGTIDARLLRMSKIERLIRVTCISSSLAPYARPRSDLACLRAACRNRSSGKVGFSDAWRRQLCFDLEELATAREEDPNRFHRQFTGILASVHPPSHSVPSSSIADVGFFLPSTTSTDRAQLGCIFAKRHNGDACQIFENGCVNSNLLSSSTDRVPGFIIAVNLALSKLLGSAGYSMHERCCIFLPADVVCFCNVAPKLYDSVFTSAGITF
jgi:hypothetical protein